MTAVMDIAVVALRMLLPFYTIVIVYQIYASMRRRRRHERPLVLLQNLDTGVKIPVLFWENSIGRNRRSDIAVDDPAVSRNHCVLLRRKEGWFISDTGSKTGTYINGKRVRSSRARVMIDDVITLGNSEYAFRRGEEFHEELQSSWFFSKVVDKPSTKPYKIMLLVSLFHIFMAVEATFCDGTENFDPAMLCGVLLGVEWLFFFISSVLLRRVAFELESLCLFLTGIGVMLLARQNIRSAYVQLIAAVIGMVVFCALVKFIENPDRIGQWKLIIMIAAVGFLAVNLVFGRVTNGANNWIQLGSITVQPSEFVKIAFIFVGASTLDRLMTKQNLLEYIIFSAICVGALAIMGDFGTALIFFAAFLLISFTRSGDIKTVILALVGASFAGVMVLNLKPYVLRRFETWRHVWEHTQDSGGYQQVRAMTYIASGGLFGVGVGNGCLKYVAASESDLVFALMSEEMGFIVAVTIAVAVATLFIYARSVATRARSTFYSISALCAAGMLVVQMALNVFGATDILPLTGVTFPFISAGGSSIIACWGLLAFIKAADERTYSKRVKN
ncbi:MAG: FtsW/RodA/SpoVE family cell cycle protein [Ruminococcus sp.]|nr:FtsW/RodA/SpoVE family cell cycle protein [Ruminococcus sp.]